MAMRKKLLGSKDLKLCVVRLSRPKEGAAPRLKQLEYGDSKLLRQLHCLPRVFAVDGFRWRKKAIHLDHARPRRYVRRHRHFNSNVYWPLFAIRRAGEQFFLDGWCRTFHQRAWI